MKTNMTIQEIKAVFADNQEAIKIAMEHKQAIHVEVDADGDIFCGHWMEEDEIIDLVEWIESETGQSLDEWAR